MKFKIQKGFTLVELIIVVTILAILATVGFISYEDYLSDTRDSKRLAQLAGLRDSMRLSITKGSLPLPDDAVEIRNNGTAFLFQGYAGKNVLESISYSENTVDPFDDTPYTYNLSRNRVSFQLLGYLEKENDQILSLHETYAVDYEDRYPALMGKNIGVILETTTNTPIQEVSSVTASGYIDLGVPGGVDYNILFKNDSPVIGDSQTILTSLALRDIVPTRTDTSIVGYWDFQGNTPLVDKSITENHLFKYGTVSIDDTRGALFVKSNGAYFEGTSNYSFGDDLSIAVYFKPLELGNGFDCHVSNLVTQRGNNCGTDRWGINYMYHSYSSGIDQRIGWLSGDNSDRYTTSNQYLLNNTIELVLVKDDFDGTFYVNGRKDSEFTMDNFGNNTFPFRIGGDGNISFFGGEIYQVIIFNRALKQNEAIDIMDNIFVGN